MKFMIGLMMVMFFAVQATLAAVPSSEVRRLLYEQKALADVEKFQVDVYNQDYSWHVGGSADFADEAKLQMDIPTGPGFYRGYASWNDKWGNSLFYSYDSKLVQFKSGINVKDFPVYLLPSRNIQLKINGPSNSDEVWVNGQRAWFSDGYWHVQVNEPWNVDELSIVWTGHGGWKVAVNPEYPFGDVVVVTAEGMDPTQDSVSQMAAVSFSGEDSWIYDVAIYQGIVGDSQGNPMAELVTSIPAGTKVMVFFSYWDQGLGTIEYYNTTVKIGSSVMRIPLSGVWFNQDQTQIRIVWQDADGKYWQAWVPMPVISTPVGGNG